VGTNTAAGVGFGGGAGPTTGVLVVGGAVLAAGLANRGGSSSGSTPGEGGGIPTVPISGR
jgi:hypothetical protein